MTCIKSRIGIQNPARMRVLLWLFGLPAMDIFGLRLPLYEWARHQEPIRLLLMLTDCIRRMKRCIALWSDLPGILLSAESARVKLDFAAIYPYRRDNPLPED